MKVLSIETSSKICSVAILEDKNLVKKIELNNGLTHSETLMPLIKQILEETNLILPQIDLLVCDIGPGSFTGIRIGVATIKAFSDSLEIPSVGISSLEGLAYSIKKDGIICSMIDCKNDNCYYAVYQLENGQYTILENPKADSVENCLTFLNYKYANSTITFVGDGACNIPVSWAFAAAKMDFEFRVAAPKRFQLPEEIISRAGGRIYQTENLAEAVDGADVLYTDTWISMGKEDEAKQRIELLSKYQINDELVAKAKPNAIVMHCLPAYRGKEITDSVFERFQQVIFDQAENRLHTQKAIMDWMID